MCRRHFFVELRCTSEEPRKCESEIKYYYLYDRRWSDQKKQKFIPVSQTKDTKASGGPFNGEFNRFISRLDNKINDRRLEFLMKPQKENGDDYTSDDFDEILKQFLGYLNKANVSIIDLSGVPFEVLSITISLISRIIFDFCFHFSKLKHERNEVNDVPFMIVCEEAHNYVRRNPKVWISHHILTSCIS